MKGNNYGKITDDHCVFVKKFFNINFIILLLYVDDMLIIGHDSKKIQRLKKYLMKFFAIKDLSLAQILDIKISRDKRMINCGCLNTIILRRRQRGLL